MIGTNRGTPQKPKKEKGSKLKKKLSSPTLPNLSDSSSGSWIASRPVDTPKPTEKKKMKKKRKMSVDLGGKKKVQKNARDGVRDIQSPVRVGSNQLTTIESVCRVKKSKRMCGSCGGKIPKKTKMVELLSGARYYHIPCFNCISCGSPLQEFAVMGGHPTCKKCLERKNYVCHECRLPIKGEFTDAMGKKWHPEHFCCTKCHKPLSANFNEQSFFVEDGKPYCCDDYFLLFGKKCRCGCGEYIKGELVECQGDNYKSECFVCKECDCDLTILDIDKIVRVSPPSGSPALFCSDRCLCSFTPSAFSAKIAKQMKLVTTEQTILSRAGHVCHWCEGPVAKNIPVLVSPTKLYFHLQHLECQDCGEHIPKEFQWRGGEACCQGCMEKRSGMVTSFFSLNSPPLSLSSFLPPMPKCHVCKEVVAERRTALCSPSPPATFDSISGSRLTLFNPAFHPSCATCCVCDSKIDSEYLWKNGFPLCKSCWVSIPSISTSRVESSTSAPPTNRPAPSSCNPSKPPKPCLVVSSPSASSQGEGARGNRTRRVTVSRAIQPEVVKEGGSRGGEEDEAFTKQMKRKTVFMPQPQMASMGGIGGVDPRARGHTLSLPRAVSAGVGGEGWLGERSRRGTTRGNLMVVREERDDYLREVPLNVEGERVGAGEGRVRRPTIMLSPQEVAAVATGGVSTKRKTQKQLHEKMLDESTVVEEIEKMIDIKHVLGRGGFATVKMAVELETGEIVAVKTFNKWELKGETLVFLKREIKALNEISHPNIVRLHQVYEDQHYVYMVIEFIKGENLFERLEANFTVSELEARTVVKRLLECLEFLHAKQIVHQDVKTENMMLLTTASDPFDAAKLIDFGFARYIKEGELIEEYCGSVDYIAPEIIERRPYGLPVDIWAAGCVMYNCLTGLRPFFSPEEAAMGSIQWFDDDWDALSPEAKDLVQGLLTVDPTKRLTATQALAHPWFSVEIKASQGEEEEKGEETDEMEEGAADFDQSEPIADTFEDSVREADDSEQVCIGCTDIIENGKQMVVSPLGTAFHDSCFTCTLCSDLIRGDYVWKFGVPYCLGCFESIMEKRVPYIHSTDTQPMKFTKDCLWCEQTLPLDTPAIISKEGHVFHPGCLMCLECSEVIGEGGQRGDFVWKRGIPCCGSCFEKVHYKEEGNEDGGEEDKGNVLVCAVDEEREIQGDCVWCEKEVGGRGIVSPGAGHVFHRGCLVCDECGEVCEEFVWREGIPCCQGCCAKLGIVWKREVKEEEKEEGLVVHFVDEEEKPLGEGGKQCMWCEKVLEKGELGIVGEGGNVFHRTCLVCEECEATCKEFVWREGIPTCRGCGERLGLELVVEGGGENEREKKEKEALVVHFVDKEEEPLGEGGKQCMWCEKALEKGELGIVGEGGNVFHRTCLVCEECEAICKEFVWREGIPTCRECGEGLGLELVVEGGDKKEEKKKGLLIHFVDKEEKPLEEGGKQCMWCEKVLEKGELGIVGEGGNAFHRTCLVCEECEAICEVFVWRAGIPTCQGCCDRLNLAAILAPSSPSHSPPTSPTPSPLASPPTSPRLSPVSSPSPSSTPSTPSVTPDSLVSPSHSDPLASSSFGPSVSPTIARAASLFAAKAQQQSQPQLQPQSSKEPRTNSSKKFAIWRKEDQEREQEQEKERQREKEEEQEQNQQQPQQKQKRDYVSVEHSPIFGSKSCFVCKNECGRGVFGVTTPYGHCFHTQCFVCSICEVKLKEEYGWGEKGPLCRKCCEDIDKQ